MAPDEPRDVPVSQDDVFFVKDARQPGQQDVASRVVQKLEQTLDPFLASPTLGGAGLGIFFYRLWRPQQA
jgi:hypothetical protein